MTVDHKPVVTWINSTTGEVKERPFHGRTAIVWSQYSDNPGFHGEYEEWEESALEMALAWVPDLVSLFEQAIAESRSVKLYVGLGVSVGDDPPAIELVTVSKGQLQIVINSLRRIANPIRHTGQSTQEQLDFCESEAVRALGEIAPEALP